MTKLNAILLTCLCALLTGHALAEDDAAKTSPATAPLTLPDWQSLEFEQKAYWATARSRLEVTPDTEDETLWRLEVNSSVVSNSEDITALFEPGTERVVSRARLSRGSGQRMKSYQYDEQAVVRERRDRPSDSSIPPAKWPVSSQRTIRFPASAADTVVTSPYLLVLVAQRLQAEGPDKAREVLVHTDQNFYRARLTSGSGVPIDADYSVEGGGSVSGDRDTVAVSIQVSPEGELSDDDDFSLLGLTGNIIIFFDSESRLPLQVRGQAPRIGETGINLKSVAMRQAGQ